MRFILVMLISTCAIVSGVEASEPFRYPEGRHGKGELRYINKVPVLIVEGTPAEIGEQVGVLALKPAAKIAKLVQDYANSQIPEALRPLVTLTTTAMYSHFPVEYQQELEAMARASGVKKNTLILANTIIDLEEMVGCASLLVASNRSTTGGPLYGRNLDAPDVEGLAEYSLLIVYRPNNQLSFAMPNLPGFLMLCSGMNSDGLALGSQSVGAPRDGSPRFSLSGVPSAVAGRQLMAGCRNVAEAQTWLEKNPLARCVNIAACDRQKQAVFEITTKKVAVRNADDGLCCATNHFRHDDLAGSTNCWRYDRLLESHTIKQLDVANVGAMMDKVNQGRMTIHTMVFEPLPLRLHLSMGPGPASAQPLIAIDLAELLASKRVDESAPK